jgi:hypothetical protein
LYKFPFLSSIPIFFCDFNLRPSYYLLLPAYPTLQHNTIEMDSVHVEMKDALGRASGTHELRIKQVCQIEEREEAGERGREERREDEGKRGGGKGRRLG